MPIGVDVREDRMLDESSLNTIAEGPTVAEIEARLREQAEREIERQKEIFLKQLAEKKARVGNNLKYSSYHLQTSKVKYFESSNFNCSAIINGNLAEIRRAERYLDPKSKRLPVDFSTFECRDFIYPNFRPKNESNFSFAYSILAYKNERQFLKLFRAIFRPWNFYCLHIDSKSREFDFLIRKLKFCFANNFFATSQREDVRWGQISLLKAALNCMQILIQNPGSEWRYLLNIAGTDFPIKTNREMIEILDGNVDSSDVENLGSQDSWKYEHSFPGGLTKENLKQFRKALKFNLTYPKKELFLFPVVKGSFSVTLSRKFVEFLFNDEDMVPRNFFDYLNDTVIPDEAYWSSLYHNYYVPKKIRENSTREFRTRYTHWGNQRPLCKGYMEHGLCVYGIRDLPWLISKDSFFAHKPENFSRDFVDDKFCSLLDVLHSDIEEFLTKNDLESDFPLVQTIICHYFAQGPITAHTTFGQTWRSETVSESQISILDKSYDFKQSIDFLTLSISSRMRAILWRKVKAQQEFNQQEYVLGQT
uniref:Uncharacterized protein n=1 Tax=Romanomermis culicivorax TaxID=13658 RepID=A0A915HFG9_ROMCU